MRAETEGVKVEALLTLDTPLLKEAWILLRGWYCEAKERPPPPAHMTIARMIEEIVELYQRPPPPGRSILVALDPFPVDNLVPDEEEVAVAVYHLCLNRSSSLSVMRV